MTTMIEKMKAALFCELGGEMIGLGRSFDGRNIYIHGDFDLDAIARAAMEAMREPSMRMITAASEIAVGYDDFACGDGAIYLPADTAPTVWSAMIDAALKEGT